MIYSMNEMIASIEINLIVMLLVVTITANLVYLNNHYSVAYKIKPDPTHPIILYFVFMFCTGIYTMCTF